MPDLNINISANIVAWYAAIVATLGFVFSAYNILRDRAKIKIIFRDDIILSGVIEGYDTNATYINITVINTGRRPVRIENAAIKITGQKGFLLLSDSFVDHRNKILTEENPKSEFLVQESLVNKNRVWYVSIYDGQGKEYRKYLSKFPTLWRIVDFIRFHN